MFEGFSFDEFATESVDFEVKKKRKFDRMWRITPGGSIESNIKISNNVLYFTSADGYIYAIYTINGKELWRFKTNEIILASPVITKGHLYVGSYDSYMYKIDLRNGHLVWKFKTGDRVACEACFYKNKIYFGSNDGCVYSLDSKTGKDIWRFNTGYEMASTPSVYNEKLFIGSFDGNLYCLNANTGKEIWRFKTGGEIFNCNPFLINNGLIYFGSFDGYLYCIGIKTGKELWRFKTGKYGAPISPILFDNIILHPSRENVFYALNPNGEELWRFYGKGIIGIPSAHNKKIYVGDENGNFYSLNSNGKELWRFKTEGDIYGSPCICGGKVYFGSFDCHLYALSINDGLELWRFTTSTLVKSILPSPYEAWETIIKTSGMPEETEEERKYETIHEVDIGRDAYKVKSEYATKDKYTKESEYK